MSIFLYFFGPMAILLLGNLVLFSYTACRIVAVRRETVILNMNDSRRHEGNSTTTYKRDRQRYLFDYRDTYTFREYNIWNEINRILKMWTNVIYHTIVMDQTIYCYYLGIRKIIVSFHIMFTFLILISNICFFLVYFF